MALLTSTNWVPKSEVEKECIYAQLEKISAHSAFKSSRRCLAFLRYVVDQQLRGDAQQLKERTIGIEVFGRDADYDTNDEPVVRTTASEVRKRIAQYYHEPGHETEIRIELPLGSYHPEFHLPHEDVSAQTAPSTHPEQGDSPERKSPAGSVIGRRIRLGIIAGTLAVVIAAPIIWEMFQKPVPAINQFWKPVLASSSPTLVCLNTWDISSLMKDSTSPLAKSAANAGIDFHEWLPITDAVAFSQITGFLGNGRANYHIQGARSTTLSDLMQGPVVLVGIFGNQWTQRVTDSLRFHFVAGDQSTGPYIADRKNPSRRYPIEGDPTSGSERDYAVVGRVFNAATGQVSFIVAGLDAPGTTASSEFITSPGNVDYLLKQLPANSSSKNIEALISVQVIGGRPGAPHIEAAEAW